MSVDYPVESVSKGPDTILAPNRKHMKFYHFTSCYVFIMLIGLINSLQNLIKIGVSSTQMLSLRLFIFVVKDH